MLCCSSVVGEHLVGQEVAASPFHSEVEGAATTQRAGPAAAAPYLEVSIGRRYAQGHLEINLNPSHLTRNSVKNGNNNSSSGL